MSEKEDEPKKSKKSSEQKADTNEDDRAPPHIYVSEADNFLAQCRKFLEKDKLSVPGDVDQADKSSGSDILLSSLTERDLYNIHQTLFQAYKTKKSENTKVLPTLDPLKSWQSQHHEAIEDEETLDSFEDAKSKFEVEAYSQIIERPISPDLMDLYNSEIRVANALRVEMSIDDENEKEAADFDPKLVYRYSSMTQEELDKLNQETTPLTLVLKKSASLELTLRLYEWSQEDLKQRTEKIKGSPLTPSTSSEHALAINLPPNLRRLRDFTFWLLSQSKKLYDLLVPDKSLESDDTNTSSRDTKDSEGNQGSNPQKGLPLNPFSDDTLSEITQISTDSESALEKDSKGSSTETTLDSTKSSPGPKPKRQRSDDTVSSLQQQTI